MHSLGHTRSALRPDHLLQTPDTFVRTVLPGMRQAAAIVHIAPAAGAAFTQYTAELEPGGCLGPVPAGASRFLYVLDGSLTLNVDTTTYSLRSGSYAHLPAGQSHTIQALKTSRLAVIEKPWLPSDQPPPLLIAHADDAPATALNGDPALEVRTLLPNSAPYDFAVNLMTYQPGASLPQVEIHLMEHGLLMLEGGGIYRLGDQWHPVTAGDFIWMAPYCPQWFGALGKTPATYLIYKDANRHPLEPQR